MQKSSNKKQKVKLNIKWTGVYDVDELFRAAAAPLQTLDEINTGLRKTTKRYKKSTFTHVIINWTLTDSLYSMLYTFAANQEMIKDHLDFKIVTHAPFLHLMKSKLPQDVVRIYDDFEALVEVLMKLPDQVHELHPQITHLAEEAKEFPDKARDIIHNSNMGVMETARALKRIGKNAKKIASAKTVIEETKVTVKALMEAIENFCEKFEGSYESIEDLGKRARNDGVLHPKQLVPKYWPEQNRVDMKLDVPPRPKGQKK